MLWVRAHCVSHCSRLPPAARAACALPCRRWQRGWGLLRGPAIVTEWGGEEGTGQSGYERVRHTGSEKGRALSVLRPDCGAACEKCSYKGRGAFLP